MIDTVSKALAGLLLVTGAFAQQKPSTVLLTTEPGLPTSTLPGVGAISEINQPWISPRDKTWASRVLLGSQAPAGTREVVVVNGSPILRQGDPVPGFPTQTVDFIGAGLGVNDLGQVAMSASSLLDRIVVRNQAGALRVIASEGDPLPGMSPLGRLLFDVSLTDSGGVGFVSDDGFLPVFGPSRAVHLDATGSLIGIPTTSAAIPIGQGGGTMLPVLFGGGSFQLSADGLNYLVLGGLGNPFDDDVLVFNGTVVLQEGFPIGADPRPLNAITAGSLDPANNWFGRAFRSPSGTLLVRNGVVVAEGGAGDSIVPRSSEVWEPGSFGTQSIAGNLMGQFVVSGFTNAPSRLEYVVVLDDGFGNRRILLRRGDPVDIDGNGLFDDDRFVVSGVSVSGQLALSSSRALVNAFLINGEGEQAACALVSVPILGPLARFTVDTQQGLAPLTVQFTGEGSSSAGSVTYSWDLDGDGVVDSTLPDPTFTYTAPGAYAVTLTVDDGFQTSTVQISDRIHVENVFAGFTMDRDVGCPPLAVQFTDTSLGAVSTYSWDFDGDGIEDSALQSPSFTYTTPGTFPVSLTVSNAFGTDTHVVQDAVSVLAPTQNTESAEILSYQFNEPRGDRVANTASTTVAPAFGTLVGGDGWQVDAGRSSFMGNEPGLGAFGQSGLGPSYVATGWDVELPGTYTVMWWQRQVSTGPAWVVASSPGGLRILVAASIVLIDGGPGFTTSDPTIVDGSMMGVWNHVALVVEATGTATWYVNGAVDNAVTGFTPTPITSGELFVGADDGDMPFTDHFDMDDFRLYLSALSQAEVQAAMMAESPTTSQYGTGCAPQGGAVPTMTGIGAPRIPNPSFAVQSSDFVPNSPVIWFVALTTATDPVGGLALPLDLGAIFPGLFGGCALDVPIDKPLGVVADASGISTVPVPVPADPMLVGMHMYIQSFGVNGAGIALSPALDINLQN